MCHGLIWYTDMLTYFGSVQIFFGYMGDARIQWTIESSNVMGNQAQWQDVPLDDFLENLRSVYLCEPIDNQGDVRPCVACCWFVIAIKRDKDAVSRTSQFGSQYVWCTMCVWFPGAPIFWSKITCWSAVQSCNMTRLYRYAIHTIFISLNIVGWNKQTNQVHQFSVNSTKPCMSVSSHFVQVAACPWCPVRKNRDALNKHMFESLATSGMKLHGFSIVYMLTGPQKDGTVQSCSNPPRFLLRSLDSGQMTLAAHWKFNLKGPVDLAPGRHIADTHRSKCFCCRLPWHVEDCGGRKWGYIYIYTHILSLAPLADNVVVSC